MKSGSWGTVLAVCAVLFLLLFVLHGFNLKSTLQHPLPFGDPRDPLERGMSAGDVQSVDDILRPNSDLANKPFRFGHMTPLSLTKLRNPGREAVSRKDIFDLLIKDGAED